MEYRRLGARGPSVSAVGFGCWAIGGHGYGEVDDRTSIAAVRRALDLGVTLFDTADVYGFGRSERVLAEALGDRLRDVVIATKFGVSWNDAGTTWRDSSPARAVAALDASLTRLGVERIPLYQVHWPDGRTPLAETLGELERQRQAGKIEFVGVSNIDAAEIVQARGTNVVTSAQYPFNLVDRSHQSDVDACSELGIGVLVYNVLGRGLFSGKFDPPGNFKFGDTRATDPNFRGIPLERMLAAACKLREIAAKRGLTPSQVAIRWTLQRREIATAIVGAKTSEQASENAAGTVADLSDSDFQELDDLVY